MTIYGESSLFLDRNSDDIDYIKESEIIPYEYSHEASLLSLSYQIIAEQEFNFVKTFEVFNEPTSVNEAVDIGAWFRDKIQKIIDAVVQFFDAMSKKFKSYIKEWNNRFDQLCSQATIAKLKPEIKDIVKFRKNELKNWCSKTYPSYNTNSSFVNISGAVDFFISNITVYENTLASNVANKEDLEELLNTMSQDLIDTKSSYLFDHLLAQYNLVVKDKDPALDNARVKVITDTYFKAGGNDRIYTGDFIAKNIETIYDSIDGKNKTKIIKNYEECTKTINSHINRIKKIGKSLDSQVSKHPDNDVLNLKISLYTKLLTSYQTINEWNEITILSQSEVVYKDRKNKIELLKSFVNDNKR